MQKPVHPLMNMEDYEHAEESSDTISASEEKQDFSIRPPYPDIGKLSTESLQKDDIKMNILSNIWVNASKFKFPLR